MEGWIKLHRKIQDHWIWVNEKYLRCWIWFLMRANHEDNKILFGAELIEIKRGSFITSINNISLATDLTKQNVRTLLKLLENDKMLNKQSNTKLTKITICNYDKYNITQHTDNNQTNTPITHEQHTPNKRATTDKKVIKKEIYIYNIFYDTQIFDNKEAVFIDKYELLIKFMFGKLDNSKILKPLLKLDDQLTYKEFINLYAKCNEKNIKVSEVFKDMYNWKKLNTKKTIYRTALTFIDNQK